MKVVYIAGPFRAASRWGVEQNIRRAEEVALEVWLLGHVALCPHTMNRFYEGAAPDELWLRGAVELLRRSDEVVLVQGWEHSGGTLAEIVDAYERGIPVYASVEDFGAGRALDVLFVLRDLRVPARRPNPVLGAPQPSPEPGESPRRELASETQEP